LAAFAAKLAPNELRAAAGRVRSARIWRLDVHILIIGAAGMVGRKLTDALVKTGRLGDGPIERLTLTDIVAPTAPAFGGAVEVLAADVSAASVAAKLAAKRPDVIFHLAAIVSGEAEADFEKGYRINLDGTRHLLEAIRLEGAKGPYKPRLVFTSSIAVFGAPFPEAIGDEFFSTPLTSYGTQKAIGELLLNDYSRKGFLDGVGIRLPTIVVRPGKPNAAASGFFSNILREPLVGQEAVLPVSKDVQHWFASPRAAVGFLLHAATMDSSRLGWRRTVSAPGLTATVGDEIEALRRIAGDKAVKLIRDEPNETIVKIVEGWPRNFAAKRALSLGFVAESSMDEIIRAHIEDELGDRGFALGEAGQNGAPGRVGEGDEGRVELFGRCHFITRTFKNEMVMKQAAKPVKPIGQGRQKPPRHRSRGRCAVRLSGRGWRPATAPTSRGVQARRGGSHFLATRQPIV
jgi:nucleoside-diphosphate-sugar epimerase